MIESARFENVNGMNIILNDNEVPFSRFATEVDTRMTERERSQQHGLYPSNTYYGKRVWHLEGNILEQNAAAYIQKRFALQGAFASRPHLGYKHVGTLYINFSGMSEELSAECTIDGYPELPMEALMPARGEYLINLKSLDPRIYGTAQTARIDIPETLGGRTYNKTYNKTYGAGNDTSDVIVVNAGNMETYPTVRVFGEVSTPRIILSRGDGEVLQWYADDLVVPPTQYLDIDFLRRTAVLNGTTNVYNYTVGSDWWALEPSSAMSSTIRYTGQITDAQTYALITWHNAYFL